MTLLRGVVAMLALVSASCGRYDLEEQDGLPLLPACQEGSEKITAYDTDTSYRSAEEAVAAAQQALGLDDLPFDELSERVWIAGDPAELEARIELIPPADGDGWFISSVATCR